jgi:hypothetical protein
MKRREHYATIRIDEKLRERIKAQADSDRRSFMNEVTVLLEEALAEREQQRTKVQRRAAN